ncbi:MAG: sulfurtransferase-like selenium metabolism protein YedF [Candidatus Anammoximicrobium sp.]|nr:sulfurtransferase-like selenium metabolism protein YedF [Candidatus Anammoximicrobium sp.]
MAKQLDLRGLVCADRAEHIRAALAESGLESLDIVVDDDAKADHARDTAAPLGWSAAVPRQGAEVHVILTRDRSATPVPTPAAALPTTGRSPRVVGYIASSVLGVGDEQLGRVLMRAFVKTLKELDPLPERLIFVNSGVRLTTKGSELIADLRELESRGVRILSCGTCLDYYQLKDALEIGTATNMHETVTALAEADRVLKP